MSATPFTPTPFATPIVAPTAATLTRAVPYIGPSEFKAAPTALAVNNLIPGGSTDENMAELYNVLLRASDWVDLICFHGADGTLAASPTIQSGWVRWRTPTSQQPGGYRLICNFKPILEVTGIALGINPQQLINIDQVAANSISIETSIITLGCGNPPLNTWPTYFRQPGRTYAVWSYINGYPHMTLADDAAQGATSITVTPGVPGGTQPYGVFPGTQLTIRDAIGGVEVVVVQSVAGNVLTLTAPLQYAHTVPEFPDFLYVTAVPAGVEQACVSLTSCLIKLRGTRAAAMSSQPGGAMTKGQLLQSGGIEDFEIAERLLKPFTSIYRTS